jgi:hypothetical protein
MNKSFTQSFLGSSVGANATAAVVGVGVLYALYKFNVGGFGDAITRTFKGAKTAVNAPANQGRQIQQANGLKETLQAIFQIGPYDNMAGIDTPSEAPPISDAPYRVEGTTGTGRSMIPSNATPGYVPEYVPFYTAPDESFVLGDIGDAGARPL